MSEHSCVFGISENHNGPVAVIAVTKAAWEHMRDGKTHTFDLTSLGFPVQIMLFGADDSNQAMSLMRAGADAAGEPFVDATGHDFSMKPKVRKQ